MGHWDTCPPRLPTISFLVHFGVGLNLTANYPSIVYSARSAGADVNNSQLFRPVLHLLVIEQLLHPALKFAVSAPLPNFQLCSSSQQILATPLKGYNTQKENHHSLTRSI